MFRRLSNSLPKDPVFPTNFDDLGYFINDSDQIRYKKKPELEFIFKIDKNERINEMQREAMNQCIRNNLMDRLEKLGLMTLRIPLSARPDKPHLPILTTPDVSKKDRVIVYFGEPCQDLGIFAYRTVGTECIHRGSIQDFVDKIHAGCASVDIHKAVNRLDGVENSHGEDIGKRQSTVQKQTEIPGLIVANPGQLVWHCAGKKAMTLSSWQCLPRKTAVHEVMRIDPVRNRIPGNEDVDKHVAYMFETVLPTLTRKNVQVDVIAMEWTSYAVVRYLNTKWSKVASTVSTLVLGAPQHTKIDVLDPDSGTVTEFSDFIARRGRCYLLSKEPADTPISGSDVFGMNCYSSGEEFYSEKIPIEAADSIFGWLSLAHGIEGFQEIAIDPALMTGMEENLMVQGPDSEGW